MSERIMRNLINDTTEGLIETKVGSEVEDIGERIIPNLSKEAVKYALGGLEKKKLQIVNELLSDQSIGIAVLGTFYHAGEVPNVRLDQYLEPDLKESYTLRFVVNPTVAYTLESADDIDCAVLAMKELMLKAHKSWVELKRRGAFKPVRETWQ